MKLVFDVQSNELASVPLTDEELAEIEKQKANALLLLPQRERDKRNKMLSDSDWTQVLDAPVDKAAWATYRQALRDVPQQVGFPSTVNWPVEPS